MIKFFVTFLSKACNIQFSPLFSLLSNGLLMSIGFLLILDTSGWLECFHHQEDNSCSDECVKFNSNASKPTFTQVPRRQKLNCLTLFFLIGFGFQFLPFFFFSACFSNKNWTGNYRLKSNGEIAKDHATKRLFQKILAIFFSKKFQISFIEFYHVLWLKKGEDQNWCHYRH